ANYGYSQVSTKESFTTYDKAMFFMPSGQGGLFYQMSLPGNFCLGAEFLYVRIEGEQQYSVLDEESLHWTDVELRQHISYFGIPFYVGYHYRWLYVNLGVQGNLALKSNGKEIYSYGGYYAENEMDNLYIENYDLGIRPGLVFKVSEKFSFDVNYYHGLCNIHSNPETYDWKVRQFSFGLRYIFITVNNK
ncbi:MAG: PorT family protein, partial [Bacteroidales bacterium]|nr:PorT family protein [Bacteroidales bacterium]